MEGQSAAKLDYKPLKEDPEYLIFSDGRLLSLKSPRKAKPKERIEDGRFVTGKIDNVGFRTYAVSIPNPNTGKKLTMMHAHRLVAEYFIPNPDDLPAVHHKNGDKLDNRVENLEWTTYVDNTNEYFNKVRPNPRYHVEDIEGEKWLPVRDYPKYLVSNMGRVQNSTNHRILRLEDGSVYQRVKIGPKQQKYYIHRLVYSTFTGDYDFDGYVIDHIDNNPRNNRLDNLQKVTHAENNLKRFRK